MGGEAAKYARLVDVCKRGDFDVIYDMVSDDVEWWEVGASAPIRGKDNLIATEREELAQWSITPSVHDVLASDDHVVSLVEATAKRDDAVFNYRTVEIFHVDDEGKVTHRWSFADDTQAVKDFFA
ncbi:MAG: nuclear transport factor 2 family protein [Acidimicrobiia bacterium]